MVLVHASGSDVRPPVSFATLPQEPLAEDCSWEYCMDSAYMDLSFNLDGSSLREQSRMLDGRQ